VIVAGGVGGLLAPPSPALLPPWYHARHLRLADDLLALIESGDPSFGDLGIIVDLTGGVRASRAGAICIEVVVVLK
jgi:hypothetical protein